VPYNEELARRLREHLSSAKQVTEQEMFGGITFMIAGNMCCGVLGDDVIVRIDPTLHHDALTRPGVREFEMGGRTSKGMVRVGPMGTEDDLDLALWVRLGMNHASELPAKGTKKAAAARKRDRTTPAKKAPPRKKATPAKKKTAPAKKKGTARTRPAPLKKKAAVVKRAASVKKVNKASKTSGKKRPAPAGKKATKATRAKKVAKAKKAPRTRR
jgi:hypothetical protein